MTGPEQVDLDAIARETTTREQFNTLLIVNFAHSINPNYPERMQAMLRRSPYRSRNPNFMAFLTRVIMMAAEYGFPEAGGHIRRHEAGGWQRDMIDPRHILELGIYLARINVQIAEQKQSVIDQLKITPGYTVNERNIWADYVMPERGVVSFNDPNSYLNNPNIIAPRIKGMLPVYLPNRAFHEALDTIPFSGFKADTMSRQEFRETIFPPVQECFKNVADLESVFFHHQENWNPKPLLPPRPSGPRYLILPS